MSSLATAILVASIIGGATVGGFGTYAGISNDINNLSDREASNLLKYLTEGTTHGGINYGTYNTSLAGNAYWNSLSDAEKKALLREYFIQGRSDVDKSVDFEALIRDLGDLDTVATAPDSSEYFRDYDTVYGEAQAAIDAENQMLLDSLNSDLTALGDAYTTSRNSILTNQHMLNQQTMDTMAYDMTKARRNAIEAGASAGVRIAGNVNAMLSAQNKASQQSLETSNQLAQMLVNQRNAEAGLRDSWRDVQMSTYDRVQNRVSSERSKDQARYDDAYSAYQGALDKSVNPNNRIADRLSKYRTQYGTNSTTTN